LGGPPLEGDVSGSDEIHIVGVETRVQYRAVCPDCDWKGKWTWPVYVAEQERLRHDLKWHGSQLLEG
jgi:hypothetical protein